MDTDTKAERRFANYSAAMLSRELQQCAALHAEAAKVEAEIGQEIEARWRGAWDARFAQTGKQHGALRLDGLPNADGVTIAGEIKRTVKWDSEKLMAVASAMPWEQAKALFKIEFSVPEKVYAGLAANPDLKAQIDAARDVTTKAAPLKLVPVEG